MTMCLAALAPSRVTSARRTCRSYQPRVAVFVFDDPAFPTLQRVEGGQVYVMGCEVSDAWRARFKTAKMAALVRSGAMRWIRYG